MIVILTRGLSPTVPFSALLLGAPGEQHGLINHPKELHRTIGVRMKRCITWPGAQSLTWCQSTLWRCKRWTSITLCPQIKCVLERARCFSVPLIVSFRSSVSSRRKGPADVQLWLERSLSSHWDPACGAQMSSWPTEPQPSSILLPFFCETEANTAQAHLFRKMDARGEEHLEQELGKSAVNTLQVKKASEQELMFDVFFSATLTVILPKEANSSWGRLSISQLTGGGFVDGSVRIERP